MRLYRKVKESSSRTPRLPCHYTFYYRIFLLICINNGIDGFNLEQRLPIIKYGHTNAYFGYSVATHVIGDPKNNTKCLLVGAPLDQNLQPNTTKSGALWRCPITQRTDDCEQVITDGRRSKGGSYDVTKTYDSEILSEPSSDEIKEGQWMGVTVRSQNFGKVVVCAHRYIYTQAENRYGQGLCYVLTNDLEYDEVYEPCRGRSTAREHEDYALCQVGTSSAILEDETMVLGTPGPFTWRGTIFVTKIGGSFLERDKNIYNTDHSDARSPVDKYSYLGMSVTGGHYYDDNMAYAAGAPRSNGHGQVVIFRNQSRTNPIPLAQIIDGEQFGSSFGYEIATADINGDRKPDLIVAAPLYFSKTEGGAVYIYQNENDMLPKRATLKLTGAPESRFGLAVANVGDLNKDNCEDIAVGAPYEGDGVVYIYLGSPKGLIAEPSQKIQASELGGRGMSRPIKTFGISITGKTDLDDNSYPDIVIGAYNSSAAVILLARPIISIRTSHIINETRNIDPNRAGCPADISSNLTCFSFEACCSIDPYDGQNKELSLLYTVEAETFDHHKKFSRVFFDWDNKRSNVVSRVVKVRTDGRTSCQKVTGYIKANTRDIQTPIGFSIKYTLEEPELAESALIHINPMLDEPRSHIHFEGTFQKDCGDDDICESDLVITAVPNITHTEFGYTWTMDETELEIKINVTNLADSAYEAQLFIGHQPGVSYVATKKPTNATCNSFNTTMVACSLGNPMLRDTSTFVIIRFQPKGLEPKEKTMNFHIFANTTSKLVGKELPDQNLIINVARRAELHLRGWPTPEQSFYSGAIKITDSPMEMSDVGSPVKHSFTIFNDGPSTAPIVHMDIDWPLLLNNNPEDSLKDRYLLYLEEQPNVEIGQGECTVASEYINPLKLANKPQQDSAYLGAPASMMMRPSLHLQHFNRSQSQSHSHHSNSLSRMPRNVIERVARLERLLDGRDGGNGGSGGKGKKQDIIELDCNKGTAKCIKIICEIYNMPARSEAQVLVKARLWNSTLVNEYPRVDRVRIISRAHTKIPEDFGVEELENNDVEVETRAYPELLNQQLDTSLPLWIIICAIVGGLLLLATFTYAMYKCGFFKRRRPTDPTLSGNLEKINESSDWDDSEIYNACSKKKPLLKI